MVIDTSTPNLSQAFIFPGQAAQAVGMGKDLFDNSPAAREIFNEVDDALGRDLTILMFEGPIEELTEKNIEKRSNKHSSYGRPDPTGNHLDQ